MHTAVARLAGTVVVLAIYYGALIARPAGTPVFIAESRLQADMEASLALFSAERFADALAPTQRIVERWPSQALFHERLALILQKLDRPADEVVEWEAVMTTSPTPIDACPMVAHAYRRINRADQELDALKRCAALQPSNPDFELQLGQALLRAGHNAEARQAFERGLQIDAAYPDLHLLMGIRQFDDRQHAEARVSFERFLALAPERRDEVAIWLERTEKRR
jgi:cytochrome c-type biogenesis protein CcmH/NrfG